MATKIFIIRHGESLGNAERRFLGHTDKDLSPLGYKQAECTAEFLKNVHFDAIYSSDLIRAVHTAQPHALLRGMEVIPSVGLREIFAGDWEDMICDEIIERWGDYYKNVWHGQFGLCRIPGGESVTEAGARFAAEVKRIAELHDGGTVLIAAHAAVIRAFFAAVNNIEPQDYAEKTSFPSNASYSVVYHSEGGFTAGEYSVDAHLSSVGVTQIKL